MEEVEEDFSCIRKIQEAIAISHRLQDEKLEKKGEKIEEYKKDFRTLKEQFCNLKETLVQACEKIKHYEGIVGEDQKVLDQDSKG